VPLKRLAGAGMVVAWGAVAVTKPGLLNCGLLHHGMLSVATVT
jgi:hypothetical protein